MKPHLPRLNVSGKNNNPPLNIDYRRAGLAVATIAILSILLSIHLLPNRVFLKLGEPSPTDIIAYRTVPYIDTNETEQRRSQAAAAARKEYDTVPNAGDQAVGAMKAVFDTVETFRNENVGLSTPEKLTRLRTRLGSVLGARISDNSFTVLLTVDSKAFREIEDEALQIVSALMSREIVEDIAAMRAVRKQSMVEASKLIKDPRIAIVVGEVAQDALRPNHVYNEMRTLARQEVARKSVRPVYRQIMRGELVIAKGTPVLHEHIDKFRALGLPDPKIDYRSVVSLTLFVISAVLMVLAYLYRYHADVYANTKALLLLAVIAIFVTLALRIGGSLLGINLDPYQVGYLGILSVVTAGMLIAVLVNPEAAVLICALLSIVLSLLLNNEVRYAASALMTALVGIYSVANLRNRHDFIHALGYLAGVGVLFVWVMGGINNDPIDQMWTGTVWALVVAGAATWLFWIGTALLERPFGTTTHISLLELADSNKPLLRRLVVEAPGTYTHSVTVGYLAETAADAIGADSLVARVASYYHDIGKIRRPHFFIENQHVENVHDRINPTLSALVITSHIKDGIDVAKEFRLPKIVLDVITQHHGTSLVQYFYNQFAGDEDQSVDMEQQFRYSGPKPQTKEAAIVMLADSVEAASRCLDKPTPSKIELLANRVVAEKLRDGQLDESELTFKEVSRITDMFIRTLIGIMHARIEYPDAPGVEGKRLVANANSDTELAKETGEDSTDQESGPTSVAG